MVRDQTGAKRYSQGHLVNEQHRHPASYRIGETVCIHQTSTQLVLAKILKVNYPNSVHILFDVQITKTQNTDRYQFPVGSYHTVTHNAIVPYTMDPNDILKEILTNVS